MTESFISEIKQNVVFNVFPNLNNYHQNILFDYLIKIMDIISIKFNFKIANRKIYEHQFRQNKYRDSIGLLLMLLPFIDDTLGIKKKNLKSLEDLYVKKKNNININESEPQYEYSNLQYGRCKRIIMDNNIIAEEIKFSEEHLKDNFILLQETIRTVANKLYINWINVRPVDEYNAINENNILYEKTNNAIINHKIIHWDPNENNNENKLYAGIDAGEIYDIMSNYLYYEIKNIKWMIYEIYIEEKPYKYLNILSGLINIENCAKNIYWNNLLLDDKKRFDVQWNNFIEIFLKGGSYGNLNSNKISYIMGVLIIFFNKNYKSIKDAIDDGYIKLFSKIEDGDEDNEDLANISKQNLIKNSVKKND